MSAEPFMQYLEFKLGRLVDTCLPVEGTGMEATELLWWLTEMFSEDGLAIDDVPYDASAETEADTFLEKLAFSEHGSKHSISKEAARVLKERLIQTIVTAVAGEKLGCTWILPPTELSIGERQVAFALFRLHGMPLYFAPGTSVPKLPL